MFSITLIQFVSGWGGTFEGQIFTKETFLTIHKSTDVTIYGITCTYM